VDDQKVLVLRLDEAKERKIGKEKKEWKEEMHLAKRKERKKGKKEEKENADILFFHSFGIVFNFSFLVFKLLLYGRGIHWRSWIQGLKD